MPEVLTLSQQIQRVVDQRHGALDTLTPLVTQAKEWKTWVDGINSFLNDNDSNWDAIIWESGDVTVSKWDSIKESISSFKDKVYNLLETEGDYEGSLTEAYARAERNYLNLGSIGPWRRGKSELIARMTQLDSWIVPRSKLDKCTGTTINIVNDKYYSSPDDQQGHENVALIYHYSVEEMCVILNKYFDYLDIDLHIDVNTPSEFKAFCNANRRKILETQNQVGKKGFKDTLDEYNLLEAKSLNAFAGTIYYDAMGSFNLTDEGKEQYNLYCMIYNDGDKDDKQIDIEEFIEKYTY